MYKTFDDYQAKHNFLICVDSDGCMFDTMEIKHKECFCPATIQTWGLQAISKYVREVWEFGNLYSIYRGQSRFIELCKTFYWLKHRADLIGYDFQYPDIASFEALVSSGKTVNNSVLAELGKSDPVMQRAYEWSINCNQRIKEMVYNIPPFPFARESLAKASQKADVVIVSATATDALEREWTEHNLLQYVTLLCGQDAGTKKECISQLSKVYNPENILMIGDAWGDKVAAMASKANFYPICPGKEVDSWKCFYNETLNVFLNGKYLDSYYQNILVDFENALPDVLPWPTI